MRNVWLAAGTAIIFIGTPQSGALSQAPAPQGSDTAASDAAIRDPATIAALDKMGAALRKLTSFRVRADTTEEKVLTTGQKVQFGGMTDIKVSRPNGLRIDKVSDRQSRSFYYNGKVLTLEAPRMGYYGSVPASGTMRQTVAMVADRLGVETPLADLLSWGEDPAIAARVTSAFYVGAETIGGLACDHYAMRQEDVDWQLWIRQGAQPLPCKLVITSTDDPSMPQYSAVFSWTPQIVNPASVFTFKPTPNTHKISFVQQPNIPAAD